MLDMGNFIIFVIRKVRYSGLVFGSSVADCTNNRSRITKQTFITSQRLDNVLKELEINRDIGHVITQGVYSPTS